MVHPSQIPSLITCWSRLLLSHLSVSILQKKSVVFDCAFFQSVIQSRGNNLLQNEIALREITFFLRRGAFGCNSRSCKTFFQSNYDNIYAPEHCQRCIATTGVWDVVILAYYSYYFAKCHLVLSLKSFLFHES